MIEQGVSEVSDSSPESSSMVMVEVDLIVDSMISSSNTEGPIEVYD